MQTLAFFFQKNEREEAEKRKLGNEKQVGKEMENVDSNEEKRYYFCFLLRNMHKKKKADEVNSVYQTILFAQIHLFSSPGKPCNSPGLRVIIIICFIPDTGKKKQITPQSQELNFINILKKSVNKERRRMMSKLMAQKFGTLFCVHVLFGFQPYFFNEYRRLGRNKPVRETRFFTDDGRVLNINQGK